MPAIVPPRLDDRTWQELRDELVRRIPVHDPSWTWTDHNPSDPGIALLEVFAWLAENLLRRMDRVPEVAQLQFLSLLGLPPREATVARGRVRLDLKKGAIDPVLVPWSPTDEKLQLAAGKLVYTGLGEIEVLPVAALPMVKKVVDRATLDADELARVQDTLALHLGLPPDAPLPELDPYEGVVLPAPVGGQLPPVTELADTVGETLYVALLVPEGATGVTPADVRAAIAGRVLNVGWWSDDTVDEPFLCPRPGTRATEPDVLWELSTGGFLGAGTTVRDIRWVRLAVEDDTTGGALRGGVVRLRLPAAADIGTWALTDEEGRPVDGMGELPPAVDDDATNDRVVAWLRLRRAGGPPRSLRHVDVNVVEVEHAASRATELLGNGNARAGQVVRLSKAPVLPDSLVLEVRENAGWVVWTRVDDLSGSRGDDPHFVLDATTGEVRFGDGVNGRMPRVGEAIRARSYRWGGGAAGNLPAGSLTRVTRPAVAAGLRGTHALPLTGGADADTVETAKKRIPERLRHNDRAVAMDDFRDLALATPGAGVGRAHVLPRHLPRGHVDEVPGVVTVVVLPAWDREHPDEPVPDAEALRKVCAWLEPRRLCTTELYLVAPEYVPVWVSAGVTVKDGYGAQTVLRWVELAIRQALAPLPPYGPAGEGWPFGRTVRPEDIEAAVLAVEGVELVDEVVLRGVEIDEGGARTPVATVDPCEPQSVRIRSWQLPSVQAVRVGQGVAPALDDEPAGDTTGGWPVPAVRELC